MGCTALSAGLRGHSRGGGLQRLGDLPWRAEPVAEATLLLGGRRSEQG